MRSGHNGMPLGMVWGTVVLYLEGRRTSELLLAGLSCSYIIASGVVKDVGRTLMSDYGISEYWMPAATGGLFFLPFLFAVWLLSQLPGPTDADIQERSARTEMYANDRWITGSLCDTPATRSAYTWSASLPLSLSSPLPPSRVPTSFSVSGRSQAVPLSMAAVVRSTC